MTSKVYYEGNLRTRCIHLKSGNEIITDAPIDNFGKGEAFSPTDSGNCACILHDYCNGNKGCTIRCFIYKCDSRCSKNYVEKS